MKADKKPSPPSLTDRLKSLGVKVGATERPCPKLADPTPIERVVKSDYRQTRYGESFVYEQHFPLSHPHGHIPLRPIAFLAE
jgi:hypothetical protein